MPKSQHHIARYARVGALALHAKHDSKQLTAAARAAALNRFSRQVDPDGILPPEERERRASYARRAYFAALAIRSADARGARAKKKAGQAEGAEPAIPEVRDEDARPAE